MKRIRQRPPTVIVTAVCLIFALTHSSARPTPPLSQSSTQTFAPESQRARHQRAKVERETRLSSEREAQRLTNLSERAAKYQTVTLTAPYWTLSNGVESILHLNNTFTRGIAVTPTVYLSDGESVPITPVLVPPLASLSVSLRQILKRTGFGQLVLTYHGEPLELHASIVIQNAAQSLAVSHAFQKRSDYSSSELAGVFYLPPGRVNADLALSNTGDSMVDVAIGIRPEDVSSPDELRRSPQYSTAIGPHETRLIDLNALLGSDSVEPRGIAMSISHSGDPGTVLAHGMVTNSSGFSASVRLEELDALTGLSLVAPVYRPSELRPVAIFNNITDRDANVELQLNYFVGGEWHDLPLPAITVRPHSAQHVDLGAQTRALPASATDIGLRISESSNRSGVLADVLLLDESGSQALQLFPKGYAGEIHPSHGFPFRISGSLETLITIANPSKTDEIEYSLHLFFDGGSYTYADHSLKPGEVRHIDVRALRDQQVPGLRNTFIPRTITSGQGKVHFRPKGRSSQSAVKVLASDHAHGADQGGIAGAITFDLVTKTSVTAVCVPVCSPGIYYIFGDPAEGVVGDVLQLQVYVVLYDFSVWQVYLSPVSWNGYNPSVTSPSEWQILLVGAGTSFMSYSLTVWVYGYGCVECEGGGQFCTGEGVVEIPIIGYFDVYVYGFFVGFSSLNTEVDDPDSYSLSVSVDVPYWLNSALTVQLGEVTLLEDTVGTGTYNVPIDVLALPAGEYYQVAAYLQNAQTAQAPVGQRPILSCGVGDDRTRLVNEYRNRDHQPTCGQFSDQPSTQSFPWSVIQSHGHNHPQYALVFYLLLNSLEALRSQYPIQITVNNRVFSCPVHNDTKSNARNSPHIYGDAADIASTQTNWQAIRDAAYIADPSWCAEPFSVQMNYNHVHLDYRFHQNSYFPRACPSGWTLP